jgi:hypothetical protein
MDKPSMATLETFNRVFPHDDPRAVRRPMCHEGVLPFTPMGRRWKGYAIADAATWSGKPELSCWVREALDHTASLPPKDDKPRKAKK